MWNTNETEWDCNRASIVPPWRYGKRALLAPQGLGKGRHATKAAAVKMPKTENAENRG
jgi:hypothetical protein